MFNQVWKFFTSIKLNIVLLISLAATSIVGTLIPQNEDPAAYVQAFGEFAFQLFSILGLFDMYHSWWFQTLILLLTANIVVCSIDRMSATWKIVFAKNPSFNASRFSNLKNKEAFDDNRSPEQLKKLYLPLLGRAFRCSCLQETEKGFFIFGEKGRWTRLGVYVVHSSVIFLLVGGLIGSIFGFDGYVNIPEGEAVSSIRTRNGGKPLPLDFQIRCDDFNVTFYDSGMPKEYRSSLTIVANGQPVLNKDIIVNDPLRYKGVNMFQSSYGKLLPNEATLNFTSLKQRFYTGLQVTSDPGVGFVYLGFVLMIFGCYVTFFMSHHQICVEVVEKANRSRVIVSGKANKNKLAVQNRVKKVAQKLATLQTPTKEHPAKGISRIAECAKP